MSKARIWGGQQRRPLGSAEEETDHTAAAFAADDLIPFLPAHMGDIDRGQWVVGQDFDLVARRQACKGPA